MTTVEYREIPGWPGYFTGSDGSVLSEQRGTRKALKPYLCEGYWRLQLWRGGKGYQKTVHHLLLITFVGPPPAGAQCRHLDGNRTNNALSNICWGTRSENETDKLTHGTAIFGERNHNAKLTTTDVLEIRALVAGGMPHRAVAKRYKVWPGLISRIACRKAWKHVS